MNTEDAQARLLGHWPSPKNNRSRVIVMSVSRPSSFSSGTLAGPAPPPPFRAVTSGTLSSPSSNLKVSSTRLDLLRNLNKRRILKISIKPLGIAPDCCQPSVRDLSTADIFVNKKMTSDVRFFHE